jgi:hypothetical protein
MKPYELPEQGIGYMLTPNQVFGHPLLMLDPSHDITTPAMSRFCRIKEVFG